MRGKAEGRKKQASTWLTPAEHDALVKMLEYQRAESGNPRLSMSDYLRTQFVLPVLSINGHLK